MVSVSGRSYALTIAWLAHDTYALAYECRMRGHNGEWEVHNIAPTQRPLTALQSYFNGWWCHFPMENGKGNVKVNIK